MRSLLLEFVVALALAISSAGGRRRREREKGIQAMQAGAATHSTACAPDLPPRRTIFLRDDLVLAVVVKGRVSDALCHQKVGDDSGQAKQAQA